MNVTCPECQSVFRVDPAKVPATGIRARCSVCGGIIVIAGGTLAASVTPNGRATSGANVAAQSSTPVASPRAFGSTPPFSPPVAPRSPVAAPHVSAPAFAAAAPAERAADTAVAGTAAPTPTTGTRRAINPFLKADPEQRARRLARALVSDLVAYHPQKREEGLRNGTLRQLFRDEIKKSYEEFAEQIGRDVAQSSTHFQDALNEVLAGGRKLF